MDEARPTQPWLIAGSSIAVLLGLTLALYRETVGYLLGIWNQLATGEYAHGYMVVAISAWLIWRNRRRLAVVTPCPSSLALAAVAGASLLWAVATLIDVEVVQAASLLLLIMSVLWAVLGNRLAWMLAFPVLFIGFAIPVWFPISPLLQDLTADVVFWLIRFFNVPAFREGNLISVPAGNLSIEEACSGLRYLLAALTLGTLFGYLNYRSFGARVVVVLVAAASAIVANIIRVFIVVYLAYTTDMQHPWVEDHLYLGWYIFGGLVFVLMLVEGRLHRADTGDAEAAPPAVTSSCRAGRPQQLMLTALAALLLATGPAAAWWAKHRAGGPVDPAGIELPAGTGGWAGPLPAGTAWSPRFNGAVTSLRSYVRGDVTVWLYVAWYPVQKQGEELINDLNRISDPKSWRPAYPRARIHSVAGRQVLEQLLTGEDGKSRLVWYWYQVGGRQTVSKYEAKLLQILGMMTGRPDGAVILIATDITSERADARRDMEEFLSTVRAAVREETWKK